MVDGQLWTAERQPMVYSSVPFKNAALPRAWLHVMLRVLRGLVKWYHAGLQNRKRRFDSCTLCWIDAAPDTQASAHKHTAGITR